MKHLCLRQDISTSVLAVAQALHGICMSVIQGHLLKHIKVYLHPRQGELLCDNQKINIGCLRMAPPDNVLTFPIPLGSNERHCVSPVGAFDHQSRQKLLAVFAINSLLCQPGCLQAVPFGWRRMQEAWWNQCSSTDRALPSLAYWIMTGTSFLPSTFTHWLVSPRYSNTLSWGDRFLSAIQYNALFHTKRHQVVLIMNACNWFLTRLFSVALKLLAFVLQSPSVLRCCEQDYRILNSPNVAFTITILIVYIKQKYITLGLKERRFPSYHAVTLPTQLSNCYLCTSYMRRKEKRQAKWQISLAVNGKYIRCQEIFIESDTFVAEW